MKRVLIFPVLAVRLFAADYYVSSAGSDSNAGSAGSPWLTLQWAVNHIGCGDTLNVVANGSFVAGDATLPALAGCGLTTTIQSSKLDQFAPQGYRTNPANDTALYGKLQIFGTGVVAAAETHGFDQTFNSYCNFRVASSVFTLTCPYSLRNLANGTQVEFEMISVLAHPSVSPPAPLSFLTHYYVVNCSTSPACGLQNSTFQVSATQGGSPISITACDANCTAYGQVGIPINVNTSTSVLTSSNAFTFIGNDTPVTFISSGLQLLGELPVPLQRDTIYYVVNLSGRNFQVALMPGGAPLMLTSVGTGMISMANANVPHNWAFRGLEFRPAAGRFLYYLLLLGGAGETSIYGMVHHMEVDRCYFHENDPNALLRSIIDNGQYVYIHDTYIAGNTAGESQAIQGTSSWGPTAVVNTFIEAAGESVLYGGGGQSYPTSNQNKIFSGNYYYKPPVWKQTINTGTPSGPCWYDDYDPNHAGGEWYRDTGSGQNYQCGSDRLWHITGSALPTALTIKNMAEHKNGRYFIFAGNLFNYSWASAQSGQALIWHDNPDSGPGHANDHITAMNNKATNVYQAITQQSACYVDPIQIPCNYPPANHTVSNNLFVLSQNACGVTFTTGSNPCGQRMEFGLGSFHESGEFWNHNTVVFPDGLSGTYWAPNAFQVSSMESRCVGIPPLLDSWSITNSIHGYDFVGDCFTGSTVFANYFTRSRIARLVMPSGGVYNYTPSPGATNIFSTANVKFIANNAAVGYVDISSGDYHLAPTSPYSAANPSPALLSDDGTDIGADIDLINMATSGAAAGTPPWDQKAGLRVDPASSQVVFRFTAPTADTCTATVYGAPARVPGNVVANAADDIAPAISNALSRELYISGLQPSSQYWYKLACGGGVLMVGSVLTRAQGQGPLEFNFDWSNPTPMRYSSSRDMSNAVSLPAATRQAIPVPSNSVVYVEQGTAGPITMLIAP